MNRAPASLHLEIIDSFERLKEIRENWNKLLRSAPNSSFFLSWDWAVGWWNEIGCLQEAQLFVLTCWNKDQLLAVAPLYRESLSYRVTCLRFLSSSSDRGLDLYPERMDILYSSQLGESAARRIAEYVAVSSHTEADLIELDRLQEGSPLMGVFERKKWRGDLISIASLAAPCADLSNGFPNYLLQLSQNSRSRFRRLLKTAEKYGFYLAFPSSSQEARDFLDRLMDTHQRYWQELGEKGAFFSKDRVRFHHHLVADLFSEQRSVIIAELRDKAGTCVSHLYGFRFGSRFEFYQSATPRTETRIKSPGIVAHLLLMEKLAERGVTTYDFLGGATPYKRHLSTGESMLYSLRRFRPSLPSLLQAGTNAIRSLF